MGSGGDANTVELRLSVPVEHSAEVVWAAASDWSRQGEWMLGTEVHVTGGDGAEPGSTLAAFTGFGGVGFLDTMRITEWQPPSRCDVEHTGSLVRGTGGFHVVRAGPHSCTFVWWERLVLPLFGAQLWPVVRPAFTWGLRRSLNEFATFCGRYDGAGDVE